MGGPPKRSLDQFLWWDFNRNKTVPKVNPIHHYQVFSCQLAGVNFVGVSVGLRSLRLLTAHISAPNNLGLDPTGGCIVRIRLFRISLFFTLISLQIAIGVITSWTVTVWQQFELLAGKSAPHEFMQLLTYNATTFSDEIEKVDTVRAYHVRSSFSPVSPF